MHTWPGTCCFSMLLRWRTTSEERKRKRTAQSRVAYHNSDNRAILAAGCTASLPEQAQSSLRAAVPLNRRLRTAGEPTFTRRPCPLAPLELLYYRPKNKVEARDSWRHALHCPVPFKRISSPLCKQLWPMWPANCCAF